MLLAKCPKCHEPVTLPGLIDIETQVRCPLCAEIYTFREVLDRLPPVLEVVRSPAQVHEPAPRPLPVSAGILEPEPALALSGTEGSSIAGPFPCVDHFEVWSNEAPEPPDPVGLMDEEIASEAADQIELSEEEIVNESTDRVELAEEELVHQEYARSESFEEVVSPTFSGSREPALAGLMRRSPSGRPKRHPRNPLVEFIKVVLGGLLAIPAAQLILWWAPLNLQPQQRDPLSLGPTVGQYLPLVVPASVRNARTVAKAPSSVIDPLIDESPNEAAPPGRKSSSSPFAKLPKASTAGSTDSGGYREPPPWRNSEASSPFPLGSEATAKEAETPASEAPVFPIDPEEAQGPTVPLDSPLTISQPGRSDATEADESKEAGELKAAVARAAPADLAPVTPGSGPEPAPEATPPTASQEESPRATDPSLAQAREANERWDHAQTPSRDDHRELYRALSRLGAAATPLTPADGHPLQAEAAEFLRAISGSEFKRKLIGAAASSWLANAARENEGIALVGTVKDVTERGPWVEATVELASANRRIVTVVAPANRRSELPVGRQLVGLGRIVPQPSSVLQGYQGSAETAVVLGSVHEISTP